MTCQDLDKELATTLHPYIDFSNYKSDHPLHSTSRKGQLGLLKSETGEKKIIEYVGIRPKVYSLLVEGDDVIKTLKGVPHSVQYTITHQDYKNCLFNNYTTRNVFKTLRNVKGQMVTLQVGKVGLQSLDDKRLLLDQTKSVAYGHPEAEIDRFYRSDTEKEDDDDDDDEESGDDDE